MRVKIADIAKIAGLSTASVSRILNGHGRYSDKTAKRVKQIAAEIGYYKNRSASDLASQNNNTIGVVFRESETNFNYLVTRGIMAQTEKNHLDVIIMITDNEATNLTKIVRSMIERRVFGLLFISIIPGQNVIDTLNQTNIYAQVVGATTKKDISYVSSNDYQIGYAAAKFLIEKGYRQIGFAGINVSTDYVGSQRYQGYLQALKDFRIETDPELVYPGNLSYQSGIDSAEYYVHHSKAEALITASDEVSVGLLNGFYDLKINVPDDVAIISIDGTQICRQTRPQLTSVTQDFSKMGKEAVGTLMNPNHKQIQAINVDFKIEERKTTKKVTPS